MTRADKSVLAEWWWTIDRVALIAMFALIAIGLMLAVAASTAATGKGMVLGNFHYAAKQIVFALVAAVLLGFTSMLSPRAIKILGLVVFVGATLGCLLVLFTGSEVLGARRWLDLGWISIQPSEFLKPGFAIVGAAILADKNRMVLPRELISFLILLPALLVLILQPDDGQTGLMLALWGVLLFFAGISLNWVGILAAASMGLAYLAYVLVPHVHHRVEQFFSLKQGATQTAISIKAFAHGGLLGVGPGAGTVKYHLPLAHSDFIFAVAGEEFGLALCGLIALLFCVLSVRLLLRAAKQSDAFGQLAGAALGIVVALQALINMAVATDLMPAKGMTLPFISYGGSSLFAVALTMGFALSVTRQRPKIAERDIELFAFLKEAHA
ncbi:MAG: FtsW/RodA/SpoVE family cell cycle protein [Rhizomicrobium sp.]|jgi:cell division protein FtsW